MSSVSRRHLLRSGAALSVGSICQGGTFARATALFAGTSALAETTAIAPRERLLLDFGWKFLLGNGNDPRRDLGFGKGQGDFSKSGDFGFANEKFDDSKWRPLNLPHDWAVELPFVNDKEQEWHGFKPLGRRYPETSVGWYRRAIDIPASDRGRRLSIDFDGAFRDALVFLNGYFIGRNDNGYAPFSFDLSDFIHYGAKNTLAVRMDASLGDGWFYEGAGIYRHVWLTKSDALHLGQWESYVRTEIKGGNAALSLGTVVLNQGGQAQTCRVHWRIIDGDGKTVAEAKTADQTIEADGQASFTSSATLQNPALWSVETPVLYSAVVSIEVNGKARDAEQVRFGVRSILFDADKGFSLNGKAVKIKGTCNHQDHAGVGAALPDRMQRYRLAVLKEMGSNAVRTSHNMPTPEWVEACDRMGMLMMCETRTMSSTPEGLAQLELMIKRYRNSPSIMMWSMGNEERTLQKSGEVGVHVVATMVARAHELDPTRLCTAATTPPFFNSVAKSLDVEGFNYQLDQIDAYHKAHPKQLSIGTETASTLCTRGTYSTDKQRNWESAYDVNHTNWSELAEEWWKFYAARPWLGGGFAWTGFDYRGEPTPYSWPSINSQFGIVDMCGFPKENFFYYKAWWGADPVLHLFPHWNWEKGSTDAVQVWVHSNLDEVELLLNGNSLGKQQVQPLTHVEWKVKYEPGVLEARGMRSGKVLLTEKRETTGAPTTIKLTVDRTEIDADGEDIAVLRVEVLDKEGRGVPTADNLIGFKISGEGALIGVGNGNPNCQEPDNGSARSLFNGLAQAIVQATKKPGTIVVEASAKESNLPSVTLQIRTRQVAPRPSL